MKNAGVPFLLVNVVSPLQPLTEAWPGRGTITPGPPSCMDDPPLPAAPPTGGEQLDAASKQEPEQPVKFMAAVTAMNAATIARHPLRMGTRLSP